MRFFFNSNSPCTSLQTKTILDILAISPYYSMLPCCVKAFGLNWNTSDKLFGILGAPGMFENIVAFTHLNLVCLSWSKINWIWIFMFSMLVGWHVHLTLLQYSFVAQACCMLQPASWQMSPPKTAFHATTMDESLCCMLIKCYMQPNK